MEEERYVSSTSDERTTNNAVRHQYRVLSEIEKRQVAMIKDAGQVLLDFIEASDASREMSIAKTKVEEAVMWAVKGITK